MDSFTEISSANVPRTVFSKMFHHLFVVSIAISSFVSAIPNFYPDCSETSTCIYYQRLKGNMTDEMETSLDECQQLNAGDRKWSLIEIGTEEKLTWLNNLNWMKKLNWTKKLNQTPIAFWIGLRRDNVTTKDEACEKWKDNSKWRWISDGREIYSGFSWFNNQPRNDYFCKKNGTAMSDCGVGRWDAPNVIQFFASVCDMKLDKINEPRLLQVQTIVDSLVCESPPLRSTTPAKPTQQVRGNEAPTKESGGMPSTWVWIVLGVICAVALISVGVVVGAFIARRRRVKNHGRKRAGRGKCSEKAEDSLSLFDNSAKEYSFYQTYVELEPKSKNGSPQSKMIMIEKSGLKC